MAGLRETLEAAAAADVPAQLNALATKRGWLQSRQDEWAAKIVALGTVPADALEKYK